MNSRVTRRDLVERQQANLVNHYLSLEVTVVSVALAIAGFAAASLITDPITRGAGLAVLWLLWAAGILGIAAIYAGPMIGAFALPPSIPMISDLLPPLGACITEFLMFAVLIRQATPAPRFGTVFGTWLWLMTALGAFALATVARARHHFVRGISGDLYEAGVSEAISDYVSYMKWSAGGPAVLIAVATSGAILWSDGFRELWIAFLWPAVIIVLLLASLWYHGIQATPWRNVLAGRREHEPPRLFQWLLNRERQRRANNQVPAELRPGRSAAELRRSEMRDIEEATRRFVREHPDLVPVLRAMVDLARDNEARPESRLGEFCRSWLAAREPSTPARSASSPMPA